MTIRIVLAEDNVLLREGITRLLEREPDMTVTGVAADLPQLLAQVEAGPPDVVVTDIRMPPTGTDEGIAAAATLRATHPGVGVVVLSQYAEPDWALRLLDGGSSGRAYLLKERVSEVGELMRAVREVASGRSVVDPAVVEVLVAATARRPQSPLGFLTARERDVLAGMATGATNAAVGVTLGLSERAVEKHTNSIFAKLGLTEERDVNRRVAAVLLYLAEGPG